MSVFNLKNTNHLKSKMFFDPDGSVSVARYDTVKYPEFEHLTEKQVGFYWHPKEVDINKDRIDFSNLTKHEQGIFTNVLARQILLDSIQGRSPGQVFIPICGLPEMEVWAATWQFFETIHSRTYTHVIRNVYANPSVVFDAMKDIEQIVDCASDISSTYDDFIQSSMYFQLLGEGTHKINGKTIIVDLYELKKKLWLCVNAINILEGIRFYASFACSWIFAENQLMEGNAKLIKLICRDENLHLASTQKLLRTVLVEDDQDYIKIREETKPQVLEMFRSAISQEKDWCDYIFKDGTLIGLNSELLKEYVDYIAANRMKAVGITPDFKYPAKDPLPWTASWVSSKTRQVAPQETEQEQYTIGKVKQDLVPGGFKNFVL